jgi:hypothetical protein
MRTAIQIAIENGTRLARSVRRSVVGGISRLIHAATSIPSSKADPFVEDLEECFDPDARERDGAKLMFPGT